jgi:hypothetical protein
MALKPKDRYATAKDLAADVEHWLADEPVSAYGEPWPVRAARWGRKHKAVTATAAAVLLTATIGLAAGLYFVNAERERTDQAWKAEAIQTQLARENEKLAQENDEISRAVLDFVEDKVFAAARPKDYEGGLGYDVKLADAIKAALPFVEKNFANQSLIEARLRMTMGTSFLYLGDPKTAAKQYETARALYRDHRGPDHADTLRSMHNLANSYADAGRTQKALGLRKETLELQKVSLGADHPDTLISLTTLANSYQAAGRTQEAIKLHEETLQLQKTKLGPDHPHTLASMNNLATSYFAAGRNKEALKLREETLQLMKAKLGPDHPNTLHSMNNLAASYTSVGRNQDAIKLCEETLWLRKAKLGPDHADTLGSMNNLAYLYADAGRTQDALRMHEETLELRKVKLGPQHPDTLVSMSNLAASYHSTGRTQEALKLFQETFQLMKANLGPDHPETLRSMINLGASYTAAGRTQEALKLKEETLRIQKAKLGPDHPDTLLSMNNLANSYIALEQASDALALLPETLQLRRGRVESDPQNGREQSYLAWTHGQMGQAEQLQLDFAAAAPAYAKSVEMFEKLDQAGGLKNPFFRDKSNLYRQRLALCRKAEQAVRDLDFALKQPAAEVPQLLDMRLHYLLKEQKLPDAVESAAKMKELAGDKAEPLYNAACAYALCAATAKKPVAPGSDKLAEEAMSLLKQAVAKGYKNAAHMKQDKDLDALRQRADFKKLVSDLEKR